MSKLNLVVFALLGLISVCVGQGVTQTGQCDPNVEVVNNFEASAYLGVWYDLESLPSSFQTGTCNTATYTAAANGIAVQNTQNLNGVMVSASGTATPQANAGTSAKFDVLIGGGNTPSPYWVLDTDYETFALVYSCRNDGTNSRIVNSWILARNRGPLPAAATARISAAIARVPALREAAPQYVTRDHRQESCIVEYEGTCPTVTGIADFNVNDYLGTWLEVARYPQNAQTGQCNRAQYELPQGASAVTIENSQVTNEVRGTITGSATTVPGQSGVLAVSLNTAAGPSSQNLVVLATDYTNYALVYSCAQVATNRYRVGSWQLRRTLEPLSIEANIEINNAVNRIAPLQPGFYYPTRQDDGACFYYPPVSELPDLIELPGPCDTSITGVADFNVNRFLGDWIEEARFPQSTQRGQCNRASYGAGTTAGYYTVNNRQVLDEELRTISGQATATAQSGVLAVTFRVGGVFTTEYLYVLGTDYESYALLYTCTNIANNRRRVGSWKMRRNLDIPLSADATSNINAIITRTQGLKEDYYRTTSQDNAACFYYPPVSELPDLIELPGPCDTSITGVADFNVGRFLGDWIEEARFPQSTQTGQCNRASYAEAATAGVVTVNNRQVVNEELRTISGQATATAQSGVLAVTFNIGGQPITQNLYVLATDYVSYAVLYTCTNIENNKRRVGSWKMRRNLDIPLSADATNNINAVITRTQGLKEDYYRITKQDNTACFYYPPAADLPNLIELPGPCDTSITGMANFDAERYLGTWLEFARYPQNAQTGQCNRATYGRGTTAGVFTVRNTQVTNQALGEMVGEARPTEQSGVLQVTFVVNGETRNENLYVLATDYDTYSLVYSCRNIANNRRQVGSWKMRRSTQELGAAANNAMDNVISATQGLKEDYYRETRQDAEACFYYPRLTGNEEKVIIPGQCDAQISGVSNINVTRFGSNIWYQVRRYDAVGNRTCIAARMSMSGETYIDVNFVEVMAAETVRRVVAIAHLETAATGKFSLTVAGSEEKMEFYILATDYDNYAIAYNCANEDNNYRHVGVWLLSRTTTWPTVGNTALDALVSSRQEITRNENYFKDISHNDQCPEPSSAFIIKSSIIVIFVCTILQLVW